MIIPELDYRCDLTAITPAEIDADFESSCLSFPLVGLAEKLAAREDFPASLFDDYPDLYVWGFQVGSVTAFWRVGFAMPQSVYEIGTGVELDAQLSEAEEAYILRLIDEELGIA